MRARTLFPLLSLLAVVLVPLAADAARWELQGPAEGLPGLLVHDLLQAADASIWVATADGVARRDDRVAAASWSAVVPLGATALARVQDHVLAAGDGGALHYFDAGGQARALPAALSARAADGWDTLALLWASGRLYWSRWDPQSQAGELVSWAPGEAQVTQLEAEPAVSLNPAAAGGIWAGDANGVLKRFEGGALADAAFLPGAPSPTRRVTALATLPQGQLVVGTGSGALFVRVGASFVERDLGASLRIDDLLVDALGRLWVARSDLAQLDPRVDPAQPSLWPLKQFDAESGLAGSRQLALLESAVDPAADPALRGRTIWVGGDQGLSVQRALPWLSFSTASGELGASACSDLYAACNSIAALARRADGSTWFGATNGVLSTRLADGSWLSHAVAGNGVRDIEASPGGWLVVATGNAAGGPAELRFLRPGDAASDPLRDFGATGDAARAAALALDGEASMWVAAADGLWQYDLTARPPAGQAVSAPGLDLAGASALAVAGGRALVATDSLLLRHDPAADPAWASVAIAGLPDAPAAIAALAPHGDDWVVATDRGLLLLDAGLDLLASAGPAQGFTARPRDLAPAGPGWWWIATDDGLWRVNPAQGQVGQVRTLDGLPAMDLLAVANFDDDVWLGLDGRANGVGTAAHRFEPPNTAITGGLPDSPILTNAQALLNLSVEAIDPDSSPEGVRFQLSVDRVDWTPAVAGPSLPFRPADFGLADGSHILYVRAVDSSWLPDLSPVAWSFVLDTQPPLPQLFSPGQGAVVQGTVELRGRSSTIRFASWSLRAWPKRLGEGAVIQLEAGRTDATLDGPLHSLDTTALAEGWWVIELEVVDTEGVRGATRGEIFVDNAAPFAAETSPVTVVAAQGAAVWEVAGDAVVHIPPFELASDREVTLETIVVTGATRAFWLRWGGQLLESPAVLSFRLPAGEDPQAGWSLHYTVGNAWDERGGTLRQEGGDWWVDLPVRQEGRYALAVSQGSTPATGATLLSQLSVQPRLLSRGAAGQDGQLRISFELAREASVQALVYNRAGRPRKVLVEGRRYGAGPQVLQWDGSDHDGNPLPVGLYIVCIEADGERATQAISIGPGR